MSTSPYIITILLMVMASCDYDHRINKPGANNIAPQENQLNQLFKTGEYQATLITNKEPTPVQKNVLEKYVQLIQTDENLAKEFEKHWNDPELKDYSQLTKALSSRLNKKEYEILLSVFSDANTSTEQGTVVVLKDGHHISFKGTGKLSILDSLTINSGDTSARFKQRWLKYFLPDTAAVTIEFMPSDEPLESIFPFKPTGLLNHLPYSFTLVVARLNNSGKTFLYLEMEELFDIDKPMNSFYSIVLN